MKKTILVTGGLGYIGSHTVVELQENNYDVVVIDSLSNSIREVAERIASITKMPIKLYIADINDESLIDALFKQETIDGVIHFAAHKAVGESVQNPFKYYRNNIDGMITLQKVMRQYHVDTIVFSSSCTVYGDTKNSPINETHPVTEAISPYGTTKLVCEQILKDLCRYSGFRGIILRYFNPVGAHPSACIGELPIGVPDNLVPYITQTAAGIRDKLTVFGNDYNTADGTNIRDYIHVVDLARAHVKALDYAFTMHQDYEIFNLGTGKGHSVLEVIKAFEQASGKPLPYAIGARRAGDIEQIWADATKAAQLLKWTHQYNLYDMMDTAWKWQIALNHKQSRQG
ncbi:UDP-glucose 4-epimerase [Nitrosomonas sp. Nm51]|uniref:UDP-glucose 4-epimerase GalE n=1 Tax=Nitrosomonas sp. Nm51 TaxID=133720 RepID=UPI0008B63459|nr:UDP-glucose 4-epimerase GalE [Nitrosomonas sp. Nm51]SER22130.1 UDP-glucose 4-epimerase [Nitrosomonas sp. Nm51]